MPLDTLVASMDLQVFEPPRALLRFRLLREGDVTPGQKRLLLYQDIDDLTRLALGFATEDGEFTQYENVLLSELLARDWFVLGIDPAVPRKIRGGNLVVEGAGTYTYNITRGEGGATGDPGQVQGVVRVGGVAANREVVLLERPTDGEWRLAGHGQTPGGSGAIAVRVLGGALYAVSVDDFGIPFQADLAVVAGQRIRPSVFAGVLYQVTEAGVLPATEPAWWPITSGGSRELGTARAEAVRYYRPLAHGPVTAELT